MKNAKFFSNLYPRFWKLDILKMSIFEKGPPRVEKVIHLHFSKYSVPFLQK
jgi:hypothetical protein